MPKPKRPRGGGGKSWRAFRNVLDGKFEILKRIGTGGMGTVVLARDRIANRQVAIKMPHGAGLEPNQLERFFREGEIMASLDHPGIVRVFSCGEAEGRPYLVCELVEDAKTLTELSEEADLRRLVEVVRDVCRALGYAHQRGVVHRDLKPDNVLIDPEGRVRVTDFGLALSTDLARLTRTGMHMGTPGYMPPELWVNAKDTGPHTDTWALGSMLYQIATGGRSPYPAGSIMELAQIVNQPPLSPPPGTPPELARIAIKALSPNPDHRYPNGEALARALDAYLVGKPPAKTEPTPVAKTGGGSMTLALAVACFGVLALTGAAVAVFLILRAR